MPPYQINPVNDFYLRNSQYQNPYQPTFPPQQLMQVTTRFVTNIDEAKAAMIDGIATNLFLDTCNGKIYLKRLSNDGRSEFLTYSIDEQNNVKETDPLAEINARLSHIENFLGGIRNDKSVSSNASVQQSASISQSTTTEQNEPNGTTESTGFPKNAGNDKWQKRR